MSKKPDIVVIRRPQEKHPGRKLPIRTVCPHCQAMLEVKKNALALRSKHTEEDRYLKSFYEYTCPCCGTTQRV